MLHEVIKYTFGAAVISLAVLTLCTSSEKEKLEGLLTEADNMYKSGNYSAAMRIIEELDSISRKNPDIRREIMHLKPKIIEQQVLAELSDNDSLIAVTTLKADSLSRNMRFVSNPIEGYYVSRTEPSDINNTSGLYARMSPDGNFYMVATNTAKNGSNAISVTIGGESAISASLPSDGERVDRSGAAEVLTFMQAECDSIGRVISRHPDEPLILTFIGRGNKSISIPQERTRAIAQVYDAATSVTDMKKLQIRKARLEKTLTVARSQIARTMTDSTEHK